jgi:hypothetical protein
MKLLTHVYIANLIIKEILNEEGIEIKPIFDHRDQNNYRRGSLRENLPPDKIIKDTLWPNKDPMIFPFKNRAVKNKNAIKVPGDVNEVIRKYQRYFRGGAAGCDTVPDLLFSQFVVHPTDSGIWLEYMYDRMLMMPPGDERDKVYAFLLGYMTHLSADMFGHSYVNEYALGWFDSVFDLKTMYAYRHMALEAFMDNRIKKIMRWQDRTTAIPVDFIVSCFSDFDGVRDNIKKIGERRYTIPKNITGNNKEHVDKHAKKRSKGVNSSYYKCVIMPLMSGLRDIVRGLMQYECGWVKETFNENVRPMIVETKTLNNYLKNIDIAIKDWISTWQDILQGLLRGLGAICVPLYVILWLCNNASNLIPILSRFEDISERYGEMAGDSIEFLKIINLFSKEINDLKGLVDKIVGLLEGNGVALKKSESGSIGITHISSDENANVEDLEPGIEEKILELLEKKDSVRRMLEWLFRDGLWETVKLVHGIKKSIDKPRMISILFDKDQSKAADFYERLDRDFGKYGDIKYPYGEEDEFKAFSYCLSASKLCVIGHDGLNKYLGEGRSDYSGHRSIHAVKKLRIEITAENYSFLNLDAEKQNVMLDVVCGDSAMRTIIWQISKTDSTALCYVDLPRPIPLSEITSFRLMKKNDENWAVSDIKIYDDVPVKDAPAQNYLGGHGNFVFDKKNHTLSIPVSRGFKEHAAKEFSVPHELMSWFYSLDGADITLVNENPYFWQKLNYRNPSKYYPWEYKEYTIFSDISAPRPVPPRYADASVPGSDPWADYFNIYRTSDTGAGKGRRDDGQFSDFMDDGDSRMV